MLVYIRTKSGHGCEYEVTQDVLDRLVKKELGLFKLNVANDKYKTVYSIIHGEDIELVSFHEEPEVK